MDGYLGIRGKEEDAPVDTEHERDGERPERGDWREVSEQSVFRLRPPMRELYPYAGEPNPVSEDERVGVHWGNRV